MKQVVVTIPTVKLLSCEKALKFAFELAHSCAYKTIEYKLPFGYHDFGKYEPFWKLFAQNYKNLYFLIQSNIQLS